MVNSLINGFQLFRENFFNNDKGFFQKLTKRGQKPKIMVIACSDSRVDPAILFGTRPGELFVVRNVANLVPIYEPDDGHHGVSAAIEYGVRDLKVQHIIILGHAYCGGIQALCNLCANENQDEHKTASQNREFLDSWINIARPAMGAIDFTNWTDATQHRAERASIRNSISNLQTFPWIEQAMKNNDLHLHGWWFDMENGALWQYEEPIDDFARLIPPPESDDSQKGSS